MGVLYSFWIFQTSKIAIFEIMDQDGFRDINLSNSGSDSSAISFYLKKRVSMVANTWLS